MKPQPHQIAKYDDALAVLRSARKPHYATDIAAYTGMSMAVVRRVQAHKEAQAASNPKGKVIIQVTEMRGVKGGIAVTNTEREAARQQRAKSRKSQTEHDDRRLETEFRRRPTSGGIAVEWATCVRALDPIRRAEVRQEIETLHYAETVAAAAPADQLAAYKEHLVLLAEIDAL
jgi:predicted GIY-YIG superfamily endonuclease